MPQLKSTRLRLVALYIACGLLLPTRSLAEPWIDAGDERTRHHLQVLVDAGLLDLPLTTWPLMWSGVSRELNSINIRALREVELWSYQYLRHELRRAQQTVKSGQALYAGTHLPGLTGFDLNSREQTSSQSYLTYTGDNWAVKLQATVVGDPIDGKRYRADGSYLAANLGNWALGAGFVDRWWGPGWQNSLILSNAARPSPGIFLNRIDNHPFDTPLLSWLGPWDLNIFLNQLEGDRATAHAKLFGMRVAFRPLNSLELGLSRTAQWGGDGRPEDVRTFWNMLVGKDNRGDDGTTAENEPGNQLGGMDWRLSHSFYGVSAAFYGQIIGEDEAGGLPSHVLGMAGLETAFSWGRTHNRVVLEASNTTMEFNKGGTPNVAYEHPRYPSGYRHRGRPIGAATDNDSELVVLKGQHYFASGHSLGWTAGAGNINGDGRDKPAPSGNIYGAGVDGLRFATAEYAFPIGNDSEMSLGAQFYSETLHVRDELIDSNIYITYELRL